MLLYPGKFEIYPGKPWKKPWKMTFKNKWQPCVIICPPTHTHTTHTHTTPHHTTPHHTTPHHTTHAHTHTHTHTHTGSLVGEGAYFPTSLQTRHLQIEECCKPNNCFRDVWLLKKPLLMRYCCFMIVLQIPCHTAMALLYRMN